MSKFLQIFLFCIGLLVMVVSETLAQSGIVKDALTGLPIAFVNIGVPGKGIGTVSDEQGRFDLASNRIAHGDTLRFSIIGYQAHDLIVDLEEVINFTVKLEPTTYELQTIEVLPKDYETKLVGNHLTNQNIHAGFMNNLLGHEIGTRVKIKSRPALIEKIHIYINHCKYDSIFYRLNIYELDGKKPGRNILKSPIYLSYSKEEALEGIVLDIKQHYVMVEDDFFVSVELVKDLGERGLMFAAGFFKDRAFYRETSQARWQKAPMSLGIGIGATILQEIN